LKIRLVFTDGDWMTRHPERGSKVAVWPRAYFHLSDSAQSL